MAIATIVAAPNESTSLLQCVALSFRPISTSPCLFLDPITVQYDLLTQSWPVSIAVGCPEPDQDDCLIVFAMLCARLCVARKLLPKNRTSPFTVRSQTTLPSRVRS